MAIRFGRASIGLAVAGMALLLAAGAAIADIAPVRIDYRAEPGCPGAAAFLGAVSALTPNARHPVDAAPARRFTVRIERAGAQHVGRLRIEEIDGVGAEREVKGSTCDDVVAALALVTALAIDAGPIDAPLPSASAPPPPPSASAPPPASASASSAPPLPSASAPPRPPAPSASSAAPPPPPPPTATASASVEPPPPPAPTWAGRFELGATANAFGAVSPTVAWGGALFFDWSGWGPTGLAPSVRLGLAIAQSPAVEAGAGNATFRLIAVRFAGCPWLLALGPVQLRPCASLDFGTLHGTTAGLFENRAKTSTWADVTLGPRLQWRLGPRWVIEGEMGLLFPLIRDTFTFDDPYTVIHEVPPLSGTASLGVGWVLP